MKHFDQASATCHVYTFREGLLSALGHDLLIDVTAFSIDAGDDGSYVNARFDARSLRVICAMEKGVKRENLLSETDKKETDRNTLSQLDAPRYPEIAMASTSVRLEDGGYRVVADLQLHGKKKVITFTAGRQGDVFVVECPLDLRDFGMRPFSALFGAMKIKPGIVVRVSVPVW